MDKQYYVIDGKVLGIPSKEVDAFLGQWGSKAIKAVRVQNAKGTMLALPPGEVDGYMKDPLNKGSIILNDDAQKPVPGFTTPNPLTHPWEALSTPNNNNLNANLYQNLNIDQGAVDASAVVTPDPNKSWDSSIHGLDSTREDRTRKRMEMFGIDKEQLGDLLGEYEAAGGPQSGTFDDYLNFVFGTSAPDEPTIGELHVQNLLAGLKQDPVGVGEIGPATGPIPKVEGRQFDPYNVMLLRKLGYDHDQIEKHGDDLLVEWAREQGFASEPTSEEVLHSAAMGAAGIAVGTAGLPLTGLIKGMAVFEGLNEIENAVISKIKDKKYVPFNRWETADLFNVEGKKNRDMINLLGFIAKGYGAHKLPKSKSEFKALPKQVKDRLHAINTKFTKEMVNKHDLPKEVFIDSKTIKQWQIMGEEGVLNKEKLRILKDLELTSKQRRKALLGEGIDIKIPVEELVILRDKPYWATLKKLLRVKPGKETILSRTPTGEPEVTFRPKVKTKTPPKEPPVDTTPPPQKTNLLGGKEGIEFIETSISQGLAPEDIKLSIKTDPRFEGVTDDDLNIVDSIFRSTQRKKVATDVETEVIESEVPIIDGEGNPVIARFDDKKKVIEVNPEEFDKLSLVEQKDVLRHEEGHAKYDNLTDAEKKAIKLEYDSLPEAERLAFEKEFPTEDGYEHTEWYAQNHLKDRRGTFAEVQGDVPEQFTEVHTFNQENKLTNDLTIKFTDEKDIVLTGDELRNAGYGDLYATEEHLITKGDPRYVEGKELYAVERHASHKADADGSRGETVVWKGTSKDAYIEDAIVEPIYKKLVKEDPELLQRIKKWEQSLKLALNDLGVKAPEGMELFSSAYTFNRLGYTATDPNAAELYFLPEDIIADFDVYVGDISHITGPEKIRLKKMAPPKVKTEPPKKKVKVKPTTKPPKVKTPKQEYEMGVEVMGFRQTGNNPTGKGIIDGYDPTTNSYSFKDPVGNTITESGRKGGKTVWRRADEFVDDIKGAAQKAGTARYNDSINSLPKNKRAQARKTQKLFKETALQNSEMILGDKWEEVMWMNEFTGSEDSNRELLKILYEQIRLNLGLPEGVDLTLPAERYKHMHKFKEWMKNPQVVENPELDFGPPSFQLRPSKSEPIWHSKAVNAINKLGRRYPQESLKARNVNKFLQNEGVSAEEMKWLGMDEFLKNYKPTESIPAKDLVNFITAQQVELGDVVKGLPNQFKVGDLTIWKDGKFNDISNKFDTSDPVGNIQATISEDLELKKWQISGAEKEADAAQDWLLDYLDQKVIELKEWRSSLDVALDKDEIGRVAKQVKYLEGLYDQVRKGDFEFNIDPTKYEKEAKLQLPGGYDYRETLITLNSGEGMPFKTSHWEEPDVLAHLRHNDRYDREGNKILFLEEVQSDWHHAGDVEGYKGKYTNFRKDLDKKKAYVTIDGVETQVTPSQYSEYYKKARESVPDAPYKNFDWISLSLKRLLRMAVEGGYDKISWITGKQSAERYDARKYIDRVEYIAPEGSPIGSKRYDIAVYDLRGDRVPGFPRFQTEKELSKNLPKDLARRIIAGEGKETRFGMAEKNIGREVRAKVLTGVDLTTGGEYHMKVYDAELPARAKKLVKKFGGKLSETDLMIPYMTTKGLTNIEVLEMPEYDGWGLMGLDRYGDAMIVERPNGERMLFKDKVQADEYLDELYTSRQGANPSIEITPKMEEAFGASQPSFQLRPSKNLKALKDKRKLKEKLKRERERMSLEVAEGIPELIVNRRTNSSLKMLEINHYVEQFKRLVPSKAHRELLSFMKEKTGVPESFNRPDLVELSKDVELRKSLKPYLDSITREIDKIWQDAVKVNENLTEFEKENYLTHIWKIDKKNRDVAMDWFTTKNKFLNKRYIDTLKEGIEEYGLTPKVLDIAEIYRQYAVTTQRAIINQELVSALRDIGKAEGLTVITTAGKAPEWPELKHAAFKDRNGAYLRVHPEVKVLLDVVFGQGLHSVPGYQAYMRISNKMKYMQLALSFFHATALFEAGIGMLPSWKAFKLAGGYFYKGLLKGEKFAWENMPQARDAMKHGVQIGVTQDFPTTDMEDYIASLSPKVKRIPGAQKFIKGLHFAVERWNQALWDYLHDGLKILSYEYQVSRIPIYAKSAKKPLSEIDIRKAKIEIAGFVNDSFGGQFTDILGSRNFLKKTGKMTHQFYSPGATDLLNAGLLSRDWNISTLRQAAGFVGLGAMYDDMNWLRKKIARRFWTREMMLILLYQAINMVNRMVDEKRNPEYYADIEGDLSYWDLSMFGNSVGKQTNVFLNRDDDGREVYLRPGKQFRESLEFFHNKEGWGFPGPLIDRVGTKMSPLLRLGITLITGGTAPGGFEDKRLKDAKGNWARTKQIFRAISESYAPFSIRSAFGVGRSVKDLKLINLFMPTSRGPSKSVIYELFVREFDHLHKQLNENTGEFELDMTSLQAIYESAIRNKLPANNLMRNALRTSIATSEQNARDRGITIEELRKELKNEANPRIKRRILADINTRERERANWEISVKGKKRLLENMEKILEFDHD